YLVNLFYDKRQYDLAQAYWERAAELNPAFPTTWRNLALLYYNKREDSAKALECMEKAFSLDETDARILMELDQLYKKLQHPHQTRLAFLQKHPGLIAQRDDLVLEEITLLNQTGRYAEAMARLDAHKFHPWEGGEGKVPMQYQTARVELAKEAIAEGRYDEAVTLLSQCLEYPHHLGEGKLHGAQENDFYYLLGVCHKATGNQEAARECFAQATLGPTEPAAAMYYNDAKPDKIFYAGLAFRALGDENSARSYFNHLVDYGKQHLHEKVRMDYFAVSLPDLQVWDGSLDEMNRIHCLYMLALGYAGLGDTLHSNRYLSEAEAININHQGLQAFKTLEKVTLK
ncbi:MAG: tetratricopeptide repeat protein, partial [Muribaculaceae bacterium]|nr:tetratricopeptide repeat protein [Muribaculaceae bacterium]